MAPGTQRRHESSSRMRLPLTAIVVALLAGCGSEAPPPEPAAGRAGGAASDPFDPEASGLTDLARLSRYVFREMRRRGECAPEPAPGERLAYSLELEVASGKIRGARLATVSAELGGFEAPLLPERWPASLVGSVECLEPHLRALRMVTPPADGIYESRFSLGGEAPPQTTPAPPVRRLPDPAEPGLPDLQRVARHVFVEMHQIADRCALRNPLGERLGYVVEIEVRGGAIARAEVTGARIERGSSSLPLVRDAWPEELERYAACLVPHLEGLRLEPAPGDGVYRPDYAAQPEP